MYWQSAFAPHDASSRPRQADGAAAVRGFLGFATADGAAAPDGAAAVAGAATGAAAFGGAAGVSFGTAGAAAGGAAAGGAAGAVCALTEAAARPTATVAIARPEPKDFMMFTAAVSLMFVPATGYHRYCRRKRGRALNTCSYYGSTLERVSQAIIAPEQLAVAQREGRCTEDPERLRRGCLRPQSGLDFVTVRERQDDI